MVELPMTCSDLWSNYQELVVFMCQIFWKQCYFWS